MNKVRQMDFDKRAADWDQNPQHAQRNDAVARAISARVSLHRGMEALEFGCGTGELTLRLAPSIGSVLATDASGGMIEQLEGKLVGGAAANITPRQLDLLVAPPMAERFDLIYSAMTLHHIEDVQGLFVRLASLLTPTGHVAVADLYSEDGSFHGEMKVPHFGFSEEQLRMFAEKAGLVLGSCEEVYAVEKNGRRYPVFLAVLSRR